jgi:hypothetical protein
MQKICKQLLQQMQNQWNLNHKPAEIICQNAQCLKAFVQKSNNTSSCCNAPDLSLQPL